MNSFSFESSSTSVNFSIETLAKITKTVVTEKFDFIYPDKTKLIALFETFELSEFCWNDQNEWFFNQILLH